MHEVPQQHASGALLLLSASAAFFSTNDGNILEIDRLGVAIDDQLELDSLEACSLVGALALEVDGALTTVGCLYAEMDVDDALNRIDCPVDPWLGAEKEGLGLDAIPEDLLDGW